MKKYLIVLILMMPIASFAVELEYVNPHYASTQKIQLEGNKTLIQYPFLRKLSREAVGDVVYYGKNYSGQKICNHLGLGDFVAGSKTIANVRSVSTSNLLLNKIGYRFGPIDRLAEDYQYPKTKIVKEIICENP